MADHSGVDLVARLRKRYATEGVADCLAAAEEIERLRRELKRFKTQVYFYRNLQLKRERGDL
jgi:hypothetical protein